MSGALTPYMGERLQKRRDDKAFRELYLPPPGLVDLSSNDYLGISRGGKLSVPDLSHGSAGSRLLSGNSALAMRAEEEIAAFHEADAAVLFNSGYDANLGLLGCMAAEGDTIIYDMYAHASIRDGIRISRASSFPYRHNDMDELERRLKAAKGNVFVVTESVFSMDGDMAPLQEILLLCAHYGARCIVDEAHATGVIGERGEGLVQHLGLEDAVWARIHTFGKALGCHGAVVLGSGALKDYLLNFSRPLIYSTALPETAVEAIRSSYQLFPGMHGERRQLGELVRVFSGLHIAYKKLNSTTPIQGILVPGNEEVLRVSGKLKDAGFDCRPIRYPTVPAGGERMRVVLHSFNAVEELQLLGSVLSDS